MDFVTIIILGIVQGITEFLPISSSGHLVIVEAVLKELRPTGVGNLGSVAVNVALHVGTLCSILVVLWRRVFDMFKQPRLLFLVCLATVPLVVVGKPLKDLFERWEQASFMPLLAGGGLLVTSTLMFLSRRFDQGQRQLSDMTAVDALVVGLLQAVAPLPGVSRSGTTIFAGLTRGLSRETAAQFSFLIAIPAILGAVVLHAKDLLEYEQSGEDPRVLAVGVLTSFLVGVAALSWLLKFVARGKLEWFAWYCLVLGTGVIIWQLTSR